MVQHQNFKSKAYSILHHSSTVGWSSYLLAGEPMITLWIRMPCVTSGKDGSLNFNSAMMLKQRDETGTRLVLDSAVTTLDSALLQGFLIVKRLPLRQCQHHYTDVPPLRLRLTKPRILKKRCTETGCVKIISWMGEQLQRIWTTQRFIASLLFFFSAWSRKSLRRSDGIAKEIPAVTFMVFIPMTSPSFEEK